MKAVRHFAGIVGICILSLCLCMLSCVKVNAYDTVNVKIPVLCVKMPEWEDYVYEIAIESENKSPVPEADTLLIPNAATGYFEIHVNEPGTFSYRIYEAPGDDLTVVYDGREYDVTVFVTNDEDDHLRYSVTASEAESDSKTDSVEFQDGWVRDTDEVENSDPSEVSEPSEISVPQDSHTVLTGDNSPVKNTAWLLFFCSLITAGIISVTHRRRNKD